MSIEVTLSIPKQKRGDPSPSVGGPPSRAMVVCKTCGLRNPVPIVAGPVAELKRPCGKCGVRSIPASQEPVKENASALVSASRLVHAS